MFVNGIVNATSKNRFMWTLQIKQGKRTRYPDVAEVMAVQDKWIEIIQKTLNTISEANEK